MKQTVNENCDDDVNATIMKRERERERGRERERWQRVNDIF